MDVRITTHLTAPARTSPNSPLEPLSSSSDRRDSPLVWAAPESVSASGGEVERERNEGVEEGGDAPGALPSAPFATAQRRRGEKSRSQKTIEAPPRGTSPPLGDEVQPLSERTAVASTLFHSKGCAFLSPREGEEHVKTTEECRNTKRKEIERRNARSKKVRLRDECTVEPYTLFDTRPTHNTKKMPSLHDLGLPPVSLKGAFRAVNGWRSRQGQTRALGVGREDPERQGGPLRPEGGRKPAFDS